jgi:hypothetical protein
VAGCAAKSPWALRELLRVPLMPPPELPMTRRPVPLRVPPAMPPQPPMSPVTPAMPPPTRSLPPAVQPVALAAPWSVMGRSDAFRSTFDP